MFSRIRHIPKMSKLTRRQLYYAIVTAYKLYGWDFIEKNFTDQELIYGLTASKTIVRTYDKYQFGITHASRKGTGWPWVTALLYCGRIPHDV
jgi:hypothetical protein